MSVEQPVLITIDDDKEFNDLLKVKLKEFNFNLHTATTKEEFNLAINQVQPDICFVDLNLDTDFGAGFQIIKDLKNKFGDKIVIFAFSKRSSREDIDNALSLGADDYLMKPLDMLILCPKLKEFCKTKVRCETISMYPINKNETSCTFDLTLSLKKVTTEGFEWKTTQLFTRKTAIKISCSVITDITKDPNPLLLTVSKCEPDPQNPKFNILETTIDSYNTALAEKLRMWIVQNK